MAKNMADYLKRGGSEPFALLPVDVQEAESVELERGVDGRVWLNVDGVCVFRCQNAKDAILTKNTRLA